MMNYKYPKQEKLKARTLINQLFTKSSVVLHYPIRLLSFPIKEDNAVTQVGVTVSKRNFKHAVNRNRIKRQLREAYRLNQGILKGKTDKPYAFMIMFVGKEELRSDVLHTKIIEAFEKWHPK